MVFPVADVMGGRLQIVDPGDTSKSIRVLFFVEGFTDVRFVIGLSTICKLTMVVPERTYVSSGLKQRVEDSGASLEVQEISGSRIGFQIRSLRYLLKNASRFDVILAQEVLRGALNATIVGKMRGVPVVTYMGIAPVEYFRCRRQRHQIGWAKALIGELTIRALMTINGKLATTCLAMGPYLRDIAARYCKDARIGLYYGVDTDLFRPASHRDRAELRVKHNLPLDKFVIFLSSRISHEKDPETVLKATAIARSRGLDAVLINLGGGYKDFLALADALGLKDSGDWVLGRPAEHPMGNLADYFRCVDAVALASLAEGAAYSTLEGLSCGTPVVATAVGGMAVQLRGFARLTTPGDAESMAKEFVWIDANRDDARSQALLGREHVATQWNSKKAFSDLREILATTVRNRRQ